MQSVRIARIKHQLITSSAVRLGGAGVSAANCTAHQVSKWLLIRHYNIQHNPLPAAECAGILSVLPMDDGECCLHLSFRMHDRAGGQSVLCIEFHPRFLAQWPSEIWSQEPALRLDHSAEHELAEDAETAAILKTLCAVLPAKDLSASLHAMERSLQILRRAIAQVAHPFKPCAVPACRFLLYESEREKIYKARDILDARYDERNTIKALAQKVAMNECYLKKGFRTLIGCTIHEYISRRRIAVAREMLEEEGRTVTEVAAWLGYNSISHFSTAFKQATGIKPCELLR